ncbi:DUF559 domain-containing protein [Marinobacter sp.]|uniref:DUF559 domain-containing protein n=1 Tax=Marinobacter sp. TaxID=50741 RepID=UPI003A9494BE
MRLKKGELERLVGAGQINPAIAAQIKAAQQQAVKATPASKRRTGAASSSGVSKGEASIRLALIHAFGDWFSGGEVVSEFKPFATRSFRADFALPRYRIYVEVDGWAHHGQYLESHHSDRERGLFFSQFDWLPFRVSHQQATQNPTMLVEAIQQVLKRRHGRSRECIVIERVMGPVECYTRLVSGQCDAG